MSYFSSLATSVWRFVSRAPSSTSSQCPPSLTSQCPTFETPPSSSQSSKQDKKAPDLLSDRSMSPITRINFWHIDTQSCEPDHLVIKAPSITSISTVPSPTQPPLSAGKKRKMFAAKIYPHPHWWPKRPKVEDLDMESMQVDSDGEDYEPSVSGSDNSEDPNNFAKQVMEDLELDDGAAEAEHVDASKTSKWLTHYHNTANFDNGDGDNKACEAELPDEVVTAVRQSYLEDDEYKEIWKRLTNTTSVIDEVRDLKESNYFIGKHGLICFLDDDNRDFVVVPDHLKSRWPEYFDSEEDEESEEMDEDEEDGSEDASEDVDDEEEVEDSEGDEMDDSGDYEMDEDEVEADDDEEVAQGEEEEAEEDEDEEVAADNEGEAADEEKEMEFEDAEEDISSLVDDGEDANESIYVKPRHRPEAYTPHKVAEIEAERQRRLLDVAHNAAAGWPVHDLTVYRALHLRGTEPLMPRDWASELLTVPLELFSEDLDAVFLKGMKLGGGCYEVERFGGKHLHEMMPIGPYIRSLSREDSYNGPERMMLHFIRNFSKWCMGDANLKRTQKLRPPILAIVMEKRRTSSDVLLKNTIKELEELEKKWKEKLVGRNLPVPPLYAMTACGMHMGFSAYVPESQRAGPGDHTKLRTLAFFGWENADYDVWNVFALAILMVHCRNILYEVVVALDELNVEVYESDPDA